MSRLSSLALSALLLLSSGGAPASARYAHRPQELERRQTVNSASPISSSSSPSSSASEILTFITPSPGASLVPITSQSQIVTTFLPQFTLCELPPLAQVIASPAPTTSTAPYLNASSASASTTYTESVASGNGSCTTVFKPTITMVCATVLTGLAQRFTVTDCDQEIPFSTVYGYALISGMPSSGSNDSAVVGALNLTSMAAEAEATGQTASVLSSDLVVTSEVSATPTPTATATAAAMMPRDLNTSSLVPDQSISIQTLTTTYLAPWQQLTAAGAAPTDIAYKICTTLSDGTEDCIMEYYVWETSLATITATSTVAVNLTTTISGPSQIIVETYAANVTETLTTFELETTMALEFQQLVVVTGVSSVSVAATATATAVVQSAQSTGPTVYETVSVVPAGGVASAASPTPTGGSTLTSTTQITRTVYVSGTTTVVMSSSSALSTATDASTTSLAAASAVEM